VLISNGQVLAGSAGPCCTSKDGSRHPWCRKMEPSLSEAAVHLKTWVKYFRVGNSSRAFSEVRDYAEMNIRTLLTRRKAEAKV
jgi:Group II intron, maturase-specific domain